jgi:hypothetical protein
LKHPGFQAALEAEHLPEQLMFRYTAWDRTLLRGVQQLPPATPPPFLRPRPNKKKKWFNTQGHNKRQHLLAQAVF